MKHETSGEYTFSVSAPSRRFGAHGDWCSVGERERLGGAGRPLARSPLSPLPPLPE